MVKQMSAKDIGKPLIVGCSCGKSHIVSSKIDIGYGQNYVVIECEECGYYWEGYVSGILSKREEGVSKNE